MPQPLKHVKKGSVEGTSKSCTNMCWHWIGISHIHTHTHTHTNTHTDIHTQTYTHCVAGEVTTEAIKAAFKAQAMQAHPDRVMAPGTPPEVQQQAVAKFQKLQVRKTVLFLLCRIFATNVLVERAPCSTC